MRLRLFLPALLLSAAGHLAAQTPALQVPSRQELDQMQQAARQMVNPAAVVLAHRADLGLTDAQVSRLQPLADQMNATVNQMFARKPSPAQVRLMEAASDSTIAIDEAAVRADYCEQSRQQADYTIAMVRTHRGVNGILTAAQREKVENLQVDIGMRMLQALSGAADRH